MRRLGVFVLFLIALGCPGYGARAGTADRLITLQARESARAAMSELSTGNRAAALEHALSAIPPGDLARSQALAAEAWSALRLAMRSRSLRLPITEAVSAVWSPDGVRVATIHWPPYIPKEYGPGKRAIEPLRLWDTRTGALIATLLTPELSVTEATQVMPGTFSADGRLLMVTVPRAGAVILFDAGTGREYWRMTGLPATGGARLGTYTAPVFSRDGRLAAFAIIGLGVGGAIELVEVATGKLIGSFATRPEVFIDAIRAMDDGSFIAVIRNLLQQAEGNLVRLDPASGKTTTVLALHDKGPGEATAVIAPDGQRVAYPTAAGTTRIIGMDGHAFAEIPATYPPAPTRFLRGGTILAFDGGPTPTYFDSSTGKALAPGAVEPFAPNFIATAEGKVIGTEPPPAEERPSIPLPEGEALVRAALALLPQAARDRIAAARAALP